MGKRYIFCTRNFAGFALLSDNSWDKAQLIFDLREEWGLDASENGDAKEDSLVFSVGTMMASIALMPTPVPHGAAELNAANNYMWPEAVETTKSHQAHLMVDEKWQPACSQLDMVWPVSQGGRHVLLHLRHETIRKRRDGGVGCRRSAL